MSNKFKLPKVTYYTDGVKKVIATTHYAGKPIRAVAVCDKDDIFDEEIGKKIAYEKLLYKFYRTKARRLFHICDSYQSLIDDMSRRMEKIYTALEESLDGYGEMCGKSSEELFEEFM